MAASSARALTSTAAQLPPVTALPSSPLGCSGSGWDEAASSAAADAAASEEAAARDADSASKSRFFTTVYQVCVAQSSTWGAASHAAPSTTSTSTRMPTPRLMRAPRL